MPEPVRARLPLGHAHQLTAASAWSPCSWFSASRPPRPRSWPSTATPACRKSITRSSASGCWPTSKCWNGPARGERPRLASILNHCPAWSSTIPTRPNGATGATSYSVGGFVGRSYLHDDNAQKGELSATYKFVIKEPGEHDVRIAYTPNANRATNVPITIHHAGGQAAAKLNEQQPPAIDKTFALARQIPLRQRSRRRHLQRRHRRLRRHRRGSVSAPTVAPAAEPAGLWTQSPMYYCVT